MASANTVAALSVALNLDKSQYDRKLRRAQSEGVQAQGRLNRAFGQVAMGAAAAAAVVATAEAFGRMAEAGGRALTVQAAFNQSMGNGAAALNTLRRATNGLIADQELMVQMNTAMTMGSARNAGEFAKLAEVAQGLGRALGVDAAFALNSLNVGIARQSRLILDNLGLIVSAEQANKNYAAALGITTDQLTDAQKAEAFRLEAMTQAEQKLNQLGPTTLNAGDAFTQFRVELTNTFDEMKRGIAESALLEAAFRSLAKTVEFTTGLATAEDRGAFVRTRVAVGRTKREDFGTEAGRQLTSDLLTAASQIDPLNMTQETLDLRRRHAEALLAFREQVRGLHADIVPLNEVLQLERNELVGLQSATDVVGQQTAQWSDELAEIMDPLSETNGLVNTLNHVTGEVTARIDDGAAARAKLAEDLDRVANAANGANAALGKMGRLTSLLGRAAGFFGAPIMGGVLSRITQGLGIGSGFTGLFGGQQLSMSPGQQNTGVTVVLNGPGLETLVDTITVQQGRSRDLRRVRRV